MSKFVIKLQFDSKKSPLSNHIDFKVNERDSNYLDANVINKSKYPYACNDIA